MVNVYTGLSGKHHAHFIFTCLPAESRAPGGASEAALSQTPAGGFSSFIEGLKSNFGQTSQSSEVPSDQALEEAASKAADEAADKALKSVGSQVPDASAIAGKGLTAGMEAETDLNSDKPAVRALADGVLLNHTLLLTCTFLIKPYLLT